MPRSDWRSSTNFVIVVVCVAVFTDIFLYGLIVPVMPFTLARRVGLPDSDVQRWTSALLAFYGGSILLGSCMMRSSLFLPIKIIYTNEMLMV